MSKAKTVKIKNRDLPIGKIILTAIIWLVGITMLFPLIWMISSSLKFETDVFSFPIKWIPDRWRAIENYKEVWGGNYNFPLYYWNSIKVTIAATFAQVFVSSLGAYGFSKIKWKNRDRLFLIYLATMMIPQQVTIVSQFIILRSINLYNTHMGLVLLWTFSVYGVFLLRQAMMGVPESLSESAKIDGANHWQIYSKIILPLIMPSIATLSILKFVWTWNDYQLPLVFLNDPKLFTLQLGMRQFASEAGTYYALTMAAAVSAILPLIIIFFIGQRYVIDGIASGAVKE